MNFRNYCAIFIGSTNGVQDEVIKISEMQPNVLDGKGMLIVTFSSIMEPNELTEWFKQNNRSFVVFELDKNVCGFNITKKHIHDGLFGFLDSVNTEDMDENFKRVVGMANDKKDSDIAVNKVGGQMPQENFLREDEIKHMTFNQRQELFNELIDFGLEKLSENDKKLLNLLVS